MLDQVSSETLSGSHDTFQIPLVSCKSPCLNNLCVLKGTTPLFRHDLAKNHAAQHMAPHHYIKSTKKKWDTYCYRIVQKPPSK